LLAIALVVCLVAAPAGLADADPASDFLLTQPAFVPPDGGIPAADAAQLQATLAAAKARGYEIRVALIPTNYDMGSVGVLFKQPRRYARFLGQELIFVYHGRVLVAMPNGYAVVNKGKPVPAAQAIVDKLPAPGSNGHSMATGATAAVAKLAGAAGVVVAAPKPASSGSGDSHWLLIIGFVVLAVLLGAAAALVLRKRRGASATV
jgi:hypothetical protein